MDPVTIGVIFAVAVISVVGYIVFNITMRETPFEETYGQNRLKLLTEDKNNKNKNKSVKTKKNGKVEIVQEPETSKTIQSVECPKEPLVKKNKKKVTKNTEPKSETSNKEVEKLPEIAPKAKRDSPDGAALNLEKLIEKISSAEGIDPEYTSYISQFAEQVKQKETKAAETISKLQRELTSKNREVESLHDQLYDAQTNIGKIQSLEQALNDEKERFRDYTFSVNPKLAENYQLRETTRKLEDTLSNLTKAHAISMEKMKRESEQIVSQLRTSLTQANNQLQLKEHHIQEIKKAANENDIKEKDAIIDELNDVINQKERLIAGIQSKFHAAENTIEELKRNEKVMIRDNEKKIVDATSKLEAELKESIDRIAVLRERNYKLVESIKVYYNTSKNPQTSDENKKPIIDADELRAFDNGELS